MLQAPLSPVPSLVPLALPQACWCFTQAGGCLHDSATGPPLPGSSTMSTVPGQLHWGFSPPTLDKNVEWLLWPDSLNCPDRGYGSCDKDITLLPQKKESTFFSRLDLMSKVVLSFPYCCDIRASTLATRGCPWSPMPKFTTCVWDLMQLIHSVTPPGKGELHHCLPDGWYGQSLEENEG